MSIKIAPFMIRSACVGAAVVLAVITGLSAPADLNWISYGGGVDSSRYFDSKEIDKANVGKLQAVWIYPFGEGGFHPLIVHNTVYTRGRRGSLIAIEAKTGRELWIREGMDAMTTRGLNYWESKDG